MALDLNSEDKLSHPEVCFLFLKPNEVAWGTPEADRCLEDGSQESKEEGPGQSIHLESYVM